MKPFVACRRCKGKGRIPDGYYPDPSNKGSVIECDHHIVWRESKELRDKYLRKGFREDGWDLSYPDGYVGNKSRDQMLRLVAFVDAFKTNPAARAATLYLKGERGCQKTILSNWVGAELTRAGFDCRFIIMNNLVHELMRAERDEETQAKLDDLSKCDLLIYDEAFDTEKLTIYRSKYQLPFIDSFIRGRLRTHANIFISNIAITDISDQFGPSLKDLIARETRYFDSDLLFEDNFADEKGKIPERIF